MDAELDPEHDGYYYNGESKDSDVPVPSQPVVVVFEPPTTNASAVIQEMINSPGSIQAGGIVNSVINIAHENPEPVGYCTEPTPTWTEPPSFPCRCSFCWRPAVGFHQTIAIAWCEKDWSIAKHKLISFGASPI